MVSDHEFVYNGMNSLDYGLHTSGEDTWKRPQPDITRIQVPGRNGDLIQLGNRYQNVEITYKCGIIEDLKINFDAFNARLLTDPGYHRLEDSYHPEYYRMAVFESALDPDVKSRAVHGEVKITFNCKPQLYLKSGEVERTVTDGGIMYNPTMYNSLPLIRFHLQNAQSGGSITIGGRTLSIQEDPNVSGDYMVDCEKQDIYDYSTKVNKNDLFTLSDGEFFELTPGRNVIYCVGVSGGLRITPNWWTV